MAMRPRKLSYDRLKTCADILSPSLTEAGGIVVGDEIRIEIELEMHQEVLEKAHA